MGVLRFICAQSGCFAETDFEDYTLDSGTTLICNKCHKETVVDLSTPEQRTEMFTKIKMLKRADI